MSTTYDDVTSRTLLPPIARKVGLLQRDLQRANDQLALSDLKLAVTRRQRERSTCARVEDLKQRNYARRIAVLQQREQGEINGSALTKELARSQERCGVQPSDSAQRILLPPIRNAEQIHDEERGFDPFRGRSWRPKSIIEGMRERVAAMMSMGQ